MDFLVPHPTKKWLVTNPSSSPENFPDSEMLMQSHDGFIKLLPALLDEWNDIEYKGVVTRGAFELNFLGRIKR